MDWTKAQRHVSSCLATRLEETLSTVGGSTWWQDLVLPSLSEPQRLAVDRRGISQLQDLDLAALLSIALKHSQTLRDVGYGDEALRPRLGDVKAARNRRAGEWH